MTVRCPPKVQSRLGCAPARPKGSTLASRLTREKAPPRTTEGSATRDPTTGGGGRRGPQIFPQRRKRIATASHHLNTEQWRRTDGSFLYKASDDTSRQSGYLREGRGLHGKPPTYQTCKTLSRGEAALEQGPPPYKDYRAYHSVRRQPKTKAHTTTLLQHFS
jgi:hypothetical protein